MQIYKLSPAFLAQAKRRFILVNVPVGTALYSRFAWALIDHQSFQESSSPNLLVTAAILLFIYLLLALAIIQSALKNYYVFWKTYEIRIDDESITQVKNGSKDIYIRRADISKIYEVLNIGITIQGLSEDQIISIPKTLERFEFVRHMLSQGHPAQQVSNYQRWSNTLNAWFKVIILPFGISILIVKFSQVSSLFLAIPLAWWTKLILADKGLPRKTKRQRLILSGYLLFFSILASIVEIIAILLG